VRKRAAIAGLLIAAFAICGRYSFETDIARRDIAQLHPDWTVLDVGEGDGSAVWQYLDGELSPHRAESVSDRIPIARTFAE
jgi:hypothetical protein